MRARSTSLPVQVRAPQEDMFFKLEHVDLKRLVYKAQQTAAALVSRWGLAAARRLCCRSVVLEIAQGAQGLSQHVAESIGQHWSRGIRDA